MTGTGRVAFDRLHEHGTRRIKPVGRQAPIDVKVMVFCPAQQAVKAPGVGGRRPPPAEVRKVCYFHMAIVHYIIIMETLFYAVNYPQ